MSFIIVSNKIYNFQNKNYLEIDIFQYMFWNYNYKGLHGFEFFSDNDKIKMWVSDTRLAKRQATIDSFLFV